MAYPGFQRGGCLRSGPIRKAGGGGGGGAVPIEKRGGGGASPGQVAVGFWPTKKQGGGGGGGGCLDAARFSSFIVAFREFDVSRLIINSIIQSIMLAPMAEGGAQAPRAPPPPPPPGYATVILLSFPYNLLYCTCAVVVHTFLRVKRRDS